MESSSSSSPEKLELGEKNPAGEVQIVSSEKDMENAAKSTERPSLGHYFVFFFLINIL